MRLAEEVVDAGSWKDLAKELAKDGAGPMLGKTHVTGALAAGAAGAALLGVDPVQATVMGSTSALAAGLPDEDRVLDDGPGHRSITHSVAFAAGVAFVFLSYLGPRLSSLEAVFANGISGLPVLGGLAGPEVASSAGAVLGAWFAETVLAGAVGAGIGYVSHLALDALTPAGVWVLLPGGPRISLPVVSKVGNATEKLINRFLALCAFVAAGAVVWNFERETGGWLTGLVGSVVSVLASYLKEVLA